MALPTASRIAAALLVLGAASGPLAADAQTLTEDQLRAVPVSEEALVLAPTAGRDQQFLPADKRALVASMTVPEQPPVPTRTVLPAYPSVAQRSRLQGTVCARVLVDTSGQVARVGRISGHRVFHAAVRQAAAQWRFAPARQGQLPVQTWVTLPFDFQM